MALLRRRRMPARLVPTYDRFQASLALVERAKDSLVTAVPGPRSPGLPLAEALAAYTETLAEARETMSGWRVTETEEVWIACSAGIDSAIEEADRLRIEAPELGFESLVGTIGDLLGPLDPFETAADRFLAMRE